MIGFDEVREIESISISAGKLKEELKKAKLEQMKARTHSTPDVFGVLMGTEKQIMGHRST